MMVLLQVSFIKYTTCFCFVLFYKMDPLIFTEMYLYCFFYQKT